MRTVLRNAAKVAVFAATGSGPMLRRRLDKVRQAGVTTILNLHRVAPDDGSTYRPLNPALFDELLSFIKREFSVVTFSNLAAAAPRPKLILSFDDGYKDFADYTVPLLRKHGLRANQNIIPGCVETGLPPLNVIAQDFVGQAPASLVAALKIDGYDGPRDSRFGGQLSLFIKMRTQAAQDRLADQLMPQFYRWADFKPTPMMTLEEVRSIADHELGAHSYQHSSMEFETDEFLQNDLERCDAFFRDCLRKQMTIYAFPNGSARQGQIDQVQRFGIEHVLLVGESFDRSSAVHSRFTYDARGRSEARMKALGGLAPVQ